MISSTVQESLGLSLKDLPLLVLESVCEYLATSGSTRRSLFSFSLTSKHCCAVADRERFERIRFSVGTAQQLESAMTLWDDILRIDNRYRYVRRIQITVNMRILEDEDPGPPERVGYYPAEHVYDAESDGGSEGYHEEEGFVRPSPQPWPPGGDPIITPETKKKCNQLWETLAQFLVKYPGLKQLIWASTDQVPRCILDILQHRIQLHVNSFRLRSLYQTRADLHDVDIDVDEYALASSPCLSSICAVSTNSEPYGFIDYNEEAVLRMVMGTAPNLRNVCMWYQDKGDAYSADWLAGTQTRRASWYGFVAGKKQEDGNGRPQGRLKKLAFSGTRGGVLLEELQRWSQCTDFSVLRSLSLWNPLPSTTLEALADMAKTGIFKRLETLSINFHQVLDQESTAARFLCAVRPLVGLKVLNYISKAIVTPALEHHGTSLQRLSLPIQFSYEEILALRKSCPNIRSLRLSIKRTQGSESEVRLYRALGSIPRLSHLTLILDCEDESTLSYLDEEILSAQTIQRMRSALANSAIDAPLALSIFHTILSANRAARTPGTIPSFRKLKVRTFCGELGLDFERVQHWVARSWMCESERIDVCTPEVVVREIGKTRRLIEMEDFKWFGNDWGLYRPAWEGVWPEAKGKSDWEDEFHSLPLWKES